MSIKKAKAKRTVILLIIIAVFMISWLRFAELSLLVIGHPKSTGLLQSEKEAPFFRQLSELSGLPLSVVYKPLDEIGLMDEHQLKLLQEGAFDLVSLRFLQNSDIEPSLQGIDLVGLNTDYETAHQVIDAYKDTVDQYLQTSFNAKLLGVWSLGPQEFYCREPIYKLSDIKNRKVRVGRDTLSAFIEELGGTPVVMRFEDTYDALAIGLIDCAVTGAASANYNGWPAHATYYFPLAVHFGLNGYAISLDKWQKLSEPDQQRLQQIFEHYITELWRYTEALHRDAVNCSIGKVCRENTPYNMKLVQPDQADINLLRAVMKKKAIAEWGNRCDQIHPGCYKRWQDRVEHILEQKTGVTL